MPTHCPPQPAELALPQILAIVVTGGNLGQVENLAEPAFPDGGPEGRDPWPMLMLLSAKFEKQKACMQFLWRDSWAPAPGGSDAMWVGVWSEILHLTASSPADAAGLQSMLGGARTSPPALSWTFPSRSGFLSVSTVDIRGQVVL